jgi:N-methylhydantoinase A
MTTTSKSAARFLGIDTGGTFTDFVLADADGLRVHKELSTPAAPEEAILRGMAALGLLPPGDAPLAIVHGSTVATNAVLEGKGARTVFVTNRGFGDLLAIGRQARPELYELQPLPQPPPVPAALCVETGGRLGARGETVEPLTPADLDEVVAEVTARAPDAVAVTLLFSFLDPSCEQAVAAALEAALPPGTFICRSSEVLPEIREYERAVATWLNAYVGPLMQGYLTRLATAVAPARLSVMQSSGLACAPDWAGRHAVNLLLSGPAGGLQAARLLAGLTGCERVLTFDMGGTSTDVALIDGELGLGTEGRIGPWPVGVPMVELHTIGAGGGSLASVDAGGLLHVGPASAGAHPGPACYGLGGTLPTVTDAHVLLGRLPATARLAGTLALDRDAAARAYAPLAAALGVSVADAARGVIELANAHMHQALRVISVGRGSDPRTATLLSFGGAGGLHVCELADSLGMREALVPAAAGVLSALGMLAAGPGRQLSASLRRRLDTLEAREVDEHLEALVVRGLAELAAEGVPAAAVTVARSLDLCYEGQSSTLALPWNGLAAAAAEGFHAAHLERYGHRLERPVQVVALRVRLQAPGPALALPRRTGRGGAAIGLTTVHGVGAVPVWRREDLPAAPGLAGPLVVVDANSTTWVAPGWLATLDELLDLRLSKADCAVPA